MLTASRVDVKIGNGDLRVDSHVAIRPSLSPPHSTQP